MVPIFSCNNYLLFLTIAFVNCGRIVGKTSLLETIHASSGSSGLPTFWARSQYDEIGTATRFEQIFRDNFNSERVRVRETSKIFVVVPLFVR